MKKILNILDTLQNLQGAKVRKIFTISKSYFAYTGKFSLTNLGRWSTGLSVRSIERFYASKQNWLVQTLTLLSVFFEHVLPNKGITGDRWCLAVDETVGKKSGKATHGLGYHYSSKEDKVIRSISVLNLSLVHIDKKVSFPVHQGQLTFDSTPKKSGGVKRKGKKSGEAAEAVGVAGANSVEKKQRGRPKGRPKGSKNKVKSVGVESDIAATYGLLKQLLAAFLAVFQPFLGGFIQFSYVVGDSGFGNNTVTSICRASSKHLISKLQYNAALYFPASVVAEKKRGRPAIYGEKLDYTTWEKYDEQYLVEKRGQKDGSTWHIYAFKNMLSKNFDIPLNIVIIVKYNKQGNLCKAANRIILFCTNNEENYNNIITIYQVRFQIEFNFRDARQHFGLTHFKNIKEKQVGNVIGFAFFMVTLSNMMLHYLKQDDPKQNIGIQDLKACFRAQKYLHELINSPDFELTSFLKNENAPNLPIIGAINL